MSHCLNSLGMMYKSRQNCHIPVVLTNKSKCFAEQGLSSKCNFTWNSNLWSYVEFVSSSIFGSLGERTFLFFSRGTSGSLAADWQSQAGRQADLTRALALSSKVQTERRRREGPCLRLVSIFTCFLFLSSPFHSLAVQDTTLSLDP